MFEPFAAAKPKPEVVWYKDDIDLSTRSDVKFKVKEDGKKFKCSMEMKNAKESDSGLYLFIATNIAGKLEVTVSVTVTSESEEIGLTAGDVMISAVTDDTIEDIAVKPIIQASVSDEATDTNFSSSETPVVRADISDQTTDLVFTNKETPLVKADISDQTTNLSFTGKETPLVKANISDESSTEEFKPTSEYKIGDETVPEVRIVDDETNNTTEDTESSDSSETESDVSDWRKSGQNDTHPEITITVTDYSSEDDIIDGRQVDSEGEPFREKKVEVQVVGEEGLISDLANGVGINGVEDTDQVTSIREEDTKDKVRLAQNEEITIIREEEVQEKKKKTTKRETKETKKVSEDEELKETKSKSEMGTETDDEKANRNMKDTEEDDEGEVIIPVLTLVPQAVTVQEGEVIHLTFKVKGQNHSAV